MTETQDQMRIDQKDQSNKQGGGTFDPLFHKAPKFDIYGNLVNKKI